VKAINNIAGIEILFNEALTQFRFGMNPRAANLAATCTSGHESEVTKISNIFGGYNVVSSNGVEAIVVPEKFARTQRSPQDSATSLDFTTLRTPES
jgi:hypothetical protein